MGEGYAGLRACSLAEVGWGWALGWVMLRASPPSNCAWAAGAAKASYPSPIEGEGSKNGMTLKLRGQFRHDLEQVADQAEIGDLEDRCVLVLVDGDDDLGILHARQVLNRA